MKHGLLCWFFICLALSLTGCSTDSEAASGMRTDGECMEGNTAADGAESDAGLFVDADCIRQCVDAAYKDEELQDGIGYCFLLTGDDLYYWNGVMAGAICGNIHIYRDAGGTREVEEIAALRDKILLFYTVDEERNLYCLYLKYAEEGNSLFLHKDGPDGVMIYDTPVSARQRLRYWKSFTGRDITIREPSVLTGSLFWGALPVISGFLTKRGSSSAPAGTAGSGRTVPAGEKAFSMPVMTGFLHMRCRAVNYCCPGSIWITGQPVP